MNRFTDAYERALLPLRARDAAGRNAGLSEIDVAVGAGWYRLVCVLEALVDGLGAALRRPRTRPAPRADARPVGCG